MREPAPPIPLIRNPTKKGGFLKFLLRLPMTHVCGSHYGVAATEPA